MDSLQEKKKQLADEGIDEPEGILCDEVDSTE